MAFTQLTGREYQIQLKRAPFGNVSRAIHTLAGLLEREGVPLRQTSAEENAFEQRTLDAKSGAFAAAGLRLRVRSSRRKVSYTYKAVSRDRYSAAAVKTTSKHKSAKTKFEENIYPFHSLYTRQTTVEPDKARDLRTVADWAALFPSAAGMSPASSLLQVAARQFFVRPGEFELDFDGTRCPATLELKYADDSRAKLLGVEFSFRHTVADEEFAVKDVRRMRRFFAAVADHAIADQKLNLAAVRLLTGL